MFENLSYNIKKIIFRFIGDIKWSGISRPFWFTINSTTFTLKGKHYREVEKQILPGDIIVRRFEGYIDKWLIPGWWNHAGMYVGCLEGKQNQVIHAISDGVISEDLIDFMRTDHLIVLRPLDNSLISKALIKAKNALGNEYDFAFDFNSTLRFSCTELIAHCYKTIIKGKKRFGRETVVADDIASSHEVAVVWDSRKRE